MPCAWPNTALFFGLLKIVHGHDLFSYVEERLRPCGNFCEDFLKNILENA